MGKSRDLLKKISDTKGNLHAKMGTIKDSKNTQKNYTKKVLKTQIIMMV